MEFLIALGVLWAIGSLFDRGGNSTERHTQKDATPKHLQALDLSKFLQGSTENGVGEVGGNDKRKLSPAELFSGIGAAAPKISIPWQVGRGGSVLVEAVCPPGIGEEVLSRLQRSGVTKLYHFTDRQNLDSIIRTGGLYSWRYLESAGVEIPRAGGSALSRQLDLQRDLQDYVRLSFIKEHPMMFAAKKDGRIFDPVVLEIDLDVVRFPDILFSDRNAVMNGAKIGSGLSALDDLDFDVIRRGKWQSEEEKHLVQAEVLVKKVVPGYLIRYEGCLIRKK